VDDDAFIKEAVAQLKPNSGVEREYLYAHDCSGFLSFTSCIDMYCAHFRKVLDAGWRWRAFRVLAGKQLHSIHGVTPEGQPMVLKHVSAQYVLLCADLSHTSTQGSTEHLTHILKSMVCICAIHFVFFIQLFFQSDQG
jgi:hypothetical protein